MSQEKLIDRVRKLLRLAENEAASQGERDNAFRMANNILIKHNLAMSEVKDVGQQEARVNEDAELCIYPWARDVSNIVARAFMCKFLFQRKGFGTTGTHTFIGRAGNAVTAAEMSRFLIANIQTEQRKLYGGITVPQARDFALGVVAALTQKAAAVRREAEVAEAKEAQAATERAAANAAAGVIALGGPAMSTSTALTIATLYTQEEQANKDFMYELYPSIKHVKDKQHDIKSRSAASVGFAHGQKLSLNAQLTGAKRAPTSALKLK